MPKYEGKKDLLVKFILNPVKINPDYPAMPNPGLKPKEAEAIAEYLLTTYKK
jgi:cytochrome c